MDQEKAYQALKQRLSNREWRLNHLYYIINKEGKKELLQLNIFQKALLKKMWFLNLILKARQLGMSTFIVIYMLDACLFNSNKSAGIIDATLPDAKKKLKKCKFAYDNLPEALKNEIRIVKDNEQELTFSNGSTITADTTFRGDTLQFLHVCLAGGTKVLMPKGYTKRIDELQIGDKVLTGTGWHRQVQEVKRMEYTKGIHECMLEVKTFGHFDPLRLTGNHSVLTRTHKTGEPVWKQAKDLTQKDYIAYPVRKPGLTKSVEQLSDGTVLQMNYATGYLAGLYLAEGHAKTTEIYLAGDFKETTNRLRQLAQLERHYIRHRIDKDGRSRTESIVIVDKPLTRFITKRFGKGKEKYIPDIIWKYPVEFQKGLIRGYLDGDGSYKNVREISATSIRYQILYQIKLLLITHRYGYPAIYYQKGGMHYGRNCQEVWTLKIMGDGNYKLRQEFGLSLPKYGTWSANYRIDHGARPGNRKNWRRGQRYYWSRIQKIEEVDPPKFVYDIVLDREPHNYVTVQGVVHNSEHAKICKRDPIKAQEIRTGALNAVAPGQIIFIESTAEDGEGDFYDMCEEAKRLKSMGAKLSKLDFKFFFFPWFENPMYKLEIPENYVFNTEAQKYFEKLADLGISLEDEQKYFYIKKWASQGSDIKKEYPSIPEEPFEASTEDKYYKSLIIKARAENRICEFQVVKGVEIDTDWDLGRSDYTSIIFSQVVGKELRVVDFLEDSGEALPFYIEELKKKGYLYGKMWLPHDAKYDLLTSEKNAYQQMIEVFGRDHVAITPKLRIETGINEVRKLLPDVWFRKSTTEKLIYHLEGYSKKWSEQTGTYTGPNHNEHSHASDGFRGLAVRYKEVEIKKEVKPVPFSYKPMGS